MKTIYEFEIGDEIVRVDPAKPYSGLIDGNPIRDRSYIGEKFIFKGIANGVLYVQPTEKISIFLAGNELMNLKLDLWDEGWEYWVDPNTITENQIPRHIIQQKLDKALEEENYELAGKLEKMLSIKHK